MKRTRRNILENGPLDKDRAFEVLFRRKTYKLVWRWLALLGVPLHDRLDETQEVLIRAYRSFPTYDPMRSRPERWLNKITVHVGSHYRQRAQHRREQLTPNDGIDAHDPSPAAPERIAAEQERRQVWDLAYYYLDPDLRGVLVAHDLDGVPMKEIAEERGIPLSTAYKWRTRALTALEAAAREAGND